MSCARLCARQKKLNELDGIDAVSKARREVLTYGALVLEQLLQRLEPKRVVFSVFGIREGLLYSLLPTKIRKQDPLLSYCETYARLRSRSVGQARELCDWTDALFGDPGPDETDHERRLRHAACLISDIGWRAHRDYRSQQSINMIAHGALGGLEHPGRVFIAQTVYFRHEGPKAAGDEGDGFSERLQSLVTKRSLNRARIVGVAIRAGHMISLGRAGILPETPVRIDGSDLVLTLPRHYADLEGERLQRRFQVLADLLELTAVIDVPS